ncbi:hypothetical protein ACLOJK_034970 [Asimina triloba]
MDDRPTDDAQPRYDFSPMGYAARGRMDVVLVLQPTIVAPLAAIPTAGRYKVADDGRQWRGRTPLVVAIILTAPIVRSVLHRSCAGRQPWPAALDGDEAPNWCSGGALKSGVPVVGEAAVHCRIVAARLGDYHGRI